MATEKRLIYANDMLLGIETFKQCYRENESLFAELACGVLSMMAEFVNRTPSVDAVEVVRCKDCKYSRLDDVVYRKTIDGETNDTTLYCCFYHWNRNEWNKGEHFCSYGERKDNG